MTGDRIRAAGRERGGPSRLLAGLIIVAGLVAVVVWWGAGRREPFGGENRSRQRTPLEVLGGPPRVRAPGAAGQFYPADPDDLFERIDDLLAASPPMGLRGVRAILVPHAGYVFSGAVAAAAFRELDTSFRRAFILAANHNGAVNFAGVSLPDETRFAIPGAQIPLSAAIDDLRDPALFVHEPRAHTMYMIEVELPFLHRLRGRPEPADYTIVPMVLGRMERATVDRLAGILDGYADDTTVFVFSVDLSHFYPDRTARELDRYTVDAIMSRDRMALATATADGNQVLDTMVALAERRGWQPTFLMARNSAAASGDTSRVVGYAAIAFHEPLSLTEAERQSLLALARTSIEEKVRHGQLAEPEPAWVDRHPIFRIPRAVFVTIEKRGRLRGCVGDLKPRKALYLSVQDAAINAAVNDSRFPPVMADELGDLSISISVLDYPSRLYASRPEEYLQRLRPGTDGVILTIKGRRSTFLPQVWRDIPEPEEFLSRLALKQGAAADAWRSPSAVLHRYGAYVFGEDWPPHRAGHAGTTGARPSS